MGGRIQSWSSVTQTSTGISSNPYTTLCLAGRCGGQGDSAWSLQHCSNLQASPDPTKIQYYKVLLWIIALNTFNCTSLTKIYCPFTIFTCYSKRQVKKCVWADKFFGSFAKWCHCIQTRVFYLNDLQLKQMFCFSVLKHFTKFNTNLFFHSAWGEKKKSLISLLT